MTSYEKEMGSKESKATVDSLPSTPVKLHLNVDKDSYLGRPSFSPSQCPTPQEEYDPTSSHPCSAFYSHPTTRTSFEQLKNTSSAAIKVYDTDLEAGKRFSCEPLSHSGTPKKDCTVWPHQSTLKQRSKDMKRRRGCMLFRRLTRKQRIIAQIVIAVLIVGAAIGIGIGVSKAVGAGVWKNNNQQSQIAR